MTSATFVIFTLLSLLTFICAQDCTDKERRKQIKPAYNVFVTRAADPMTAAQYIRAGFHDCATARKEDPLSGCNGSLKFELPAVEGDQSDPFAANLRLKDTVADIESVREIFQCLSLADSILIAYAAGARVSKAARRDLLKELVNEDNPRVDRGEADFHDGFLDLPSALEATFAGQMAFYSRKGFTEQDFVVSLVVGHSVGGFAPFAQSSPVLPFTEPSVHLVNGDYCGALLAARTEVFGPGKSPAGLIALPRFNFLPSDFSISDGAGLEIMKKYCAIDIPDKTNYALKFTEDKQAYQEDFGKFSVKMGLLHGSYIDTLPPFSR